KGIYEAVTSRCVPLRSKTDARLDAERERRHAAGGNESGAEAMNTTSKPRAAAMRGFRARCLTNRETWRACHETTHQSPHTHVHRRTGYPGPDAREGRRNHGAGGHGERIANPTPRPCIRARTLTPADRPLPAGCRSARGDRRPHAA